MDLHGYFYTFNFVNIDIYYIFFLVGENFLIEDICQLSSRYINSFELNLVFIFLEYNMWDSGSNS